MTVEQDVVISLEQTPELASVDIPMAEDRGVGWAVLRDAGPVVRVDGNVYITGRDDVLTALRNPELFSSQAAYDSLGSPFPLVPLSFDPPEHTRFRKILQPFFSPRTLGAVLPALQEQAVQLIADVTSRDAVEFIGEVAIPYPSQVFLTMFGLPLADRDRLIAWKDAVIALSAAPASSPDDLAPAFELISYLGEAVQAKRADPGDDILSSLLTDDGAEGEEPLDDTEAFGLCFLFVLAGLDTVTAAIGFALLALARDPELADRLRGDDKAIGEFVEEIVRLEPPAPFLMRQTSRETVVGGVRLPADTFVRLLVGAINREDGGGLDTPDDIVLDGVPHRHWGYGGGAHRCLGSHLARIELKLIVGEWLQRVPRFGLADGADVRMPWPAQTFGLKNLELQLIHD